MPPLLKRSSRTAKAAPHKRLVGDVTDPLFNQLVQKALAIQEAFGNECAALNLTSDRDRRRYDESEADPASESMPHVMRDGTGVLSGGSGDRASSTEVHDVS